MRFSDEFEGRFSEMLSHYPTKRSVLVPTLLYAQDEVGYLSDEVIAELATRLDLTELEVRNVISYYSMLTTKARGKYNVQVCTYFFQAEDGIRDLTVTGVQTCALPI